MAGIITKGFPKDDQIMLTEATFTYYQNPDCTEDQDGDGQEITISTRNNGVENFLNIKTDNWSISDEKDLIDLIKDFEKRTEMI